MKTDLSAIPGLLVTQHHGGHKSLNLSLWRSLNMLRSAQM